MIPSLLVSMAGGMVVTRASSDSTLSRRSRHATSLAAPPAADCRRRHACAGGDSRIAEVFLLLVARRRARACLASARAERSPATPRPDCRTRPQKKTRKPPRPTRSKTCSSSTNSRSKSATLWSRWSMPHQGGQLLARVKVAAQQSGPATRLHRSSDPHHRQRAPQAARICHLAARRRNGALGDARGPAAGHQLRSSSPPPLAGTPTTEPAFGVAAALDSRARCESRRSLPATRSSIKPLCLPRTWPKSSGSMPTNCSPGRKPSVCSTASAKVIPSSSKSSFPKILSLGEVQKVLQQLLREQVSIRDLPTILETLLDASAATKNPVAAGRSGAPGARPRPGASAALRRRRPARGHARSRHRRRAQPRLQRPGRRPEPAGAAAVVCPPHSRGPEAACRRPGHAWPAPVLLCSTPARFHLRRLLEPFLPKVVVLSPLEIPPMVPVQSVGMVR